MSPGLTATLCTAAFACVVAGDAVRRRLKQTRSCPPYPLPPGPPPLPIIGNIYGVNASAPWLTYAEWSKVYGVFFTDLPPMDNP